MDREKVRNAFHRQAHQYDRHAVVQRAVVDQLLERLERTGVRPRRLLDVGAGTGRLLAALHLAYPEAAASGVDLAPGMCESAAASLRGTGIEVLNADAEHLPFPADSFDLVLSTSTFQWLTTLDNAFAEAYRVLQPGGLFCFALFGEDTLFELRESYDRADGGSKRSLAFFSCLEVLAALDRTGFEECQVESELEREYHADVPELLRSLKEIGAKTVAPVVRKGLSERRVMLEMMEIYRREHGGPKGIPATYEVLYGLGWKR
ncbi:malonyl-ACP O-methyltransferase BioC [Geomonas sp. RF6]|uniref:malonyl-ACP O-methyltransferase BioC n=1 Tax=Geomonas sp. RF6 TaxID=2897342 RepID=UPI001E6328F2|nr:malonyl-ACP O-methyltransferase BioC [Geomonas sp. RF6]UFS68623.1 malonyl-ACP O-methyltransferase BioC [Geomonas sp. RF6]